MAASTAAVAAAMNLHPTMNWDADDVVEAFKKFKQKSQLAFKSFLKGTTDEEKVSYILLWLGEKGLDIFNSWSLTEPDCNNPGIVLERFANHMEPKSNHRIHRYEFQGLRQDPQETTDTFLSRLRNVAKKCRFGDEDDRIVDQLIWGCAHQEVQKSLIGKDTLNLKDAVDAARAFEATRKQMSSLSLQVGSSQSSTRVNIDALSKRGPGSTLKAPKQTFSRHANKQASQRSCWNCGTEHAFDDRRECPAYGTTCNSCGRPNHWKKMCRSTKSYSTKPKQQWSKNDRNTRRKQIHAHVQQEEEITSDTSEEEFLSVGTIDVHEMGNNKPHSNRDEAYTIIQLQKKVGKKRTTINLRLKIDTGAQSNILPVNLYGKIFPEHMTKDGSVRKGILGSSDVVLAAYGGSIIPQLGKTIIAGTYKGKEVKCPFYITKSKGPAILGLNTCQRLKIVSINHEIKTNSCRIDRNIPIKNRPPIRNKEELIDMYPECFDDTVGCFEEYEYHITVDPSVKPVIHPPRRVPLELKERLREQLNEMEKKGIITEITQPTDWVNSIVVKEKPNGKLRICLDPRDLNNALKRDHYPTPTLEEITPALAGSKVFSKLDASNGYWNIKIDQESSMLTTFNTPFGRFRFNRLPFGLKVSQDVFQRKIDETYKGCKGAIGIADDIQVYGRDENTHDYNLHEAMEKTRRAGIKLNADKCIIKERECKFFGLIYSAEGVKPDPTKVDAINHMEEPKDKKQLRSFLGLIQYMGVFIPKLANHTANLRELMKDDAEFDWCASHSQDFEKIKQLISKETILQYYDRQKPVTLQVDASMRGVGAVLIQNGRPIAYASKALTPTESRYANIERELLAVVYGCEKFHTYLYGRYFDIETDHRPLEQIEKKNLTKAPARLQRLLLRLQHYDYNIRYKPGKDLLLADALSRLSTHDKQEMEGLSIKIHHIVSVTSVKLEQIKEETARDEELQLLTQMVIQGWPEKRQQVQPLLREYWTIRDDISVENGVLMAGSRIIIPKSMQKEILEKIHQGHLGMEKCRLRAKSAVYWIGMYKDIEKLVSTCHICQKYRNSQQKEEMTPSDIPSRPWQTIGADLFTENQQWYLIMACYYSKFPFVRNVKDLKAKTIVSIVRGLFAEQGIPEQIVCDNGTQFTSREFRELATEYGFKITTSSPHYPKGHGFIERQVQTAKKTLIKCREAKEDPNLALLSLRATPLKADMKSPAEMLNGRKYKTTLPSKIQPPIDQEETRAKLAAAQEEGLKQYNKNAQYLPELFQGQNVHAQDPTTKKWTPAQITSRAGTPKSYIIETEPGRQLRRNRIHIRPTPEMSTPATSKTTPATPRTPPTAAATPTIDDNTFSQTATSESYSQPAPTNGQETTQQVTNTSSATLQATTRSTRSRSNILPPARYR